MSEDVLCKFSAGQAACTSGGSRSDFVAKLAGMFLNGNDSMQQCFDNVKLATVAQAAQLPLSTKFAFSSDAPAMQSVGVALANGGGLAV